MSREQSPLRGKLIFNVGAPRSGTFWLQRIVTAHPSVSAVPSETHLISHGLVPLLDRFHHGARNSPQVGRVHADREKMLDAARALCDSVLESYLELGTERLAERTPSHALHLDAIASIFPDARVIHIIRDGRDVARSIASQAWGPESIEKAAAEWAESIKSARGAGLSTDRYLEVRYEDLLDQPEEHIAGIYEWLGLRTGAEEVAEGVLESQRRLNVDSRRPGVKAAKWRDAWGADELRAFDRAAGTVLAELDYPAAEIEPPRSAVYRRGRSLARRTVSLFRRPSPKRTEPFVKTAGAHPDAQAIADQALERLIDQDSVALASLMLPDVFVSVVDDRGRREARGERGLELLSHALKSDDALSGTQILGDVHAAPPLITYVLSFEHAGARHDRLVIFSVRGQDLAAVHLYRLPLGGR